MVAVFANGPNWWLRHAAFPLGFACRESWERRSGREKGGNRYPESRYVGEGRIGNGKGRQEGLVVVIGSFNNSIGLVDFTVDYRFKRRRAIVTPELGRNRAYNAT